MTGGETSRQKLKRVTLTISKDYKLREMETIKEDTTETSRDLKKKKKNRKGKVPCLRLITNSALKGTRVNLKT